MTYSPMLLVHIAAGLIAVGSGMAALLVRKGSSLHRTTGRVFAISMLFMALGGVILALVRSQPGNVLAGVFTSYLVATAWLTVLRRPQEIGHAERALLLVGLATGIGGWILGLTAANKGLSSEGFVFGTVILLCSAGDARLLMRGGVSGVQRLVRHLWRMCVALFIATASFFLGTASDPALRQVGLRARLFTKAVRHTHLPEIPVLLVLVLMVYWLIRVRTAKAYRKAEQ